MCVLCLLLCCCVSRTPQHTTQVTRSTWRSWREMSAGDVGTVKGAGLGVVQVRNAYKGGCVGQHRCTDQRKCTLCPLESF